MGRHCFLCYSDVNVTNAFTSESFCYSRRNWSPCHIIMFVFSMVMFFFYVMAYCVVGRFWLFGETCCGILSTRNNIFRSMYLGTFRSHVKTVLDLYLNGKREYEVSTYSARHDWYVILTHSSCTLCSAKKKKGWVSLEVEAAYFRCGWEKCFSLCTAGWNLQLRLTRTLSVR